ncbi:mRNA 3' end processing factor [Coemansia thaxteri]|nr:mRNA 3' end processing factor [Coemansia thaxteri]
MSRPDLISSLSKVVPGLSSSLGGLLVPGHQAGTGYNSFAQVEPIPLSNASVTRKREGIHNILYQGEFPRQCSQCGWRTMGGDEGRTRMNGHLDWHFRRNLRTQSEKTRKAPMRGWYVGQAGTWETAALADDGAGSGQKTAEGADSELKKNKENGVGGPVVTAAYSGEELRQMTVAVADYNNEPCAICKEAFERKFNEDDESWVLVNAVSVDGKFYHATCQHPDHS